jgi:ribosomal protein S18 acetylase RimI-like enzyme
MDKAELLDIFTRQQRIEVDYPDIKREVDGSVIRHINLSIGGGFIIYSRLDEESVESVITAQIARFQEVPQDFEWKVYDYDTPGDLVERLRRRGFEIEEPEALLVFDLTTRPAALDRAVPPSVVRITDPADVDAIVTLENAVWGTDHHNLGELLKRELREHPEILSVYMSYDGQEPASAAWIYFHASSSFASLWGGSTLAQFRNRGHYTHLLAARAQEAYARGFTLLTVDASPMSRPILEKHGFQFLATSTPCKWKMKSEAE